MDRIHFLESKLSSYGLVAQKLHENPHSLPQAMPGQSEIVRCILPARESLVEAERASQKQAQDSSKNGTARLEKMREPETSMKIHDQNYRWTYIGEGKERSLFLCPEKAQGGGTFKSFRAVFDLGGPAKARALLRTTMQQNDVENHLALEQEANIRSLGLPHTQKMEARDVWSANGQDTFMWVEDLAQDLSLLLEEGKTLNLAEFKRIARALIEHLDALHKKGYAHLDLKPQQILVTCDAKGCITKASVTDFGLAAPMNTRGQVTVGRRGTRGYLAPEWYENLSHRDAAKIDIFTLGVTLLNMRYGHHTNYKTSEGLFDWQWTGSSRTDPAKRVQAWKGGADLDMLDLALLSCVERDLSVRPSLANLKKYLGLD
jgi:hypothetical protein